MGEDPHLLVKNLVQNIFLHSSPRNFIVDKDGTKNSESIDDDCNKDYPRAPKMTPGLSMFSVAMGFVKDLWACNLYKNINQEAARRSSSKAEGFLI